VALTRAARASRPSTLTHPPSIVSVTTEDAFDALSGEWNAVAERLPHASPFHSWEWNHTWWKHLGGKEKLQILVFRDHAEVVGIAPFFRKSYGLGGIGASSLVPIGSHHYKFGLTEQWELLFPRGERRELLAALAEWLSRHRWSVAVLPGFQEFEELPVAPRLILIEHKVQLHTLELPSNWDAFVGSLSKNLRKNIRRYPQRLIDDNYGFSFHVAETPEEVAAALPTFFELHGARAAASADEMGVRHTNRFRFPNRRAFLQEVAPLLAAKGQFKMGLLKVGHKIISCETWLEKGNAIYLYHSGVMPEFAEYSVGFVTTLEVFKHAISRGIRRVELLRGEGHYKDRWRATSWNQRTIVVARYPRLVRMALKLRRVGRG
jgi:CelD/BcsL family acetyltransferase involved in cellulose biosynthesis